MSSEDCGYQENENNTLNKMIGTEKSSKKYLNKDVCIEKQHKL